jgi:hypothetical protein
MVAVIKGCSSNRPSKNLPKVNAIPSTQVIKFLESERRAMPVKTQGADENPFTGAELFVLIKTLRQWSDMNRLPFMLKLYRDDSITGAVFCQLGSARLSYSRGPLRIRVR